MPESHLFNAAMLDYKLRTNGLGTDYTLDSYLEEQVEISNYEPYEYTVQTEELFDFVFAIFPTIIILLILVPALGFLYTEEFFLDFIFYDISINVIAAQ